MKKLLLFLGCLFLGNHIYTQSITFNRNSIDWNDDQLILKSQIGKGSPYKNIMVTNRTPYQVTAKVHTHSPRKFIWFTDSKGKHGPQITINLQPYQSTYLNAFVFLENGPSRVYNDDLGIDVYYQCRKVGYIEMDLKAHFFTPIPVVKKPEPLLAAKRPANYDAWIPFGTTPMRVNKSDLPLRVYSNHNRFTRQADFDEVIRRALYLWNVAGRDIGLQKNIFEMTSRPSEADFVIDWSGKGLAPNALGMATLSGCNAGGCDIEGIVMRPPSSHNPGQTCETLAQELGHLLGLGHSDVRDDIMNGHTHDHFHQLEEVQLSNRDRQMLGWLYSLNRYQPLRPKRQRV